MNTIEIDIPLKNTVDCFLIAGLFDLHTGVKACDEQLLDRDIERIRTTPNMYAFLGGDMCDFINYSEKRFDASTLTDKSIKGLSDLARVQAEHLIDKLIPIKHKLWFSLEGNHEEKIKLRYGNDIGNYIAMRLGIPYLGYTALIKLRLIHTSRSGATTIAMYVSHGTGGASTITGKIKKTLDLMQWVEADIYWTGHLHAKASVIQPRLYLSTKGIPVIKALNRIFILGSTYLKTYMKGENSYGERAGYAPTPLGMEVLKVIPRPGSYTENGREIVKPIEFVCQTTGSGNLEAFMQEIKK